MKRTFAQITLTLSVLALQAVWQAPSYATSGSGGGRGGGGHSRFPVAQDQDPEQDPSAGHFGGGGGGGGEGYGASPKALAAWEAAGGRKGTGMSFQDWFKKSRVDWDAKQTDLTWDASKAGWSASFWNILYGTTKVADTAGQVSQFGLNFVPGVGKIANIGLDTARGAVDGYGKAIDKGMSQSEAAQTGGTTGAASGLFSAFTSKLGFAKDAGKAVTAVQGAKTAAQIAKTNKALKVAGIGTTVQEGVKTVVGDMHSTSVVNNSSPQPQASKE